MNQDPETNVGANAAKPAFDYRRLLAKYMNHVGECEGITFVGRISANDPQFTSAELAELQAIEIETDGGL